MTDRKHYTKKFKLDAVSLVINHGHSHAEAARSLGIRANMLGRWVQEFNQDDGHAFCGHGMTWPSFLNTQLSDTLHHGIAFISIRVDSRVHGDWAVEQLGGWLSS